MGERSMRTVQLHIRAALPKRLEPLWELARNVWWSWNVDAITLFRRVNPKAYEDSGPCPLKLLNTQPAAIWEELSRDVGFLEHMDMVLKHFNAYMEPKPGQIEGLGAHTSKTQIAYFSMEFGLHESIPLYSGGLGVLAGDHLKTASDLNLPLVGVGLFYSEGYFHQLLNREGWQTERYEGNDPFYMPMSPVCDAKGHTITVHVQMDGKTVVARMWRMNVGRIPLYLLDTDMPENSDDVRRITCRLYAGGQDLRVQQEMVLGIGGVKALRALGLSPTVFHLNEGHSAFLTLERIAQGVDQGLAWHESLALAKATQVFTVHTPVPAGNDSFPVERLRAHFGSILNTYKIPDEEFYALGRSADKPEEFSMPVFALRTSAQRNGVSMLHGHVSRHIWKPLWPALQDREVPIFSITNGVHTRTWLSNELADAFDMYLGKGWETRVHESRIWQRVEAIPDGEFWDIHLLRKSRLISAVVAALEKTNRATKPRLLQEIKHSLRPEVLTIGFARRFASYKRGALLFRNIQRLKRILHNESRPVQIFIAGKAHPNDHMGKEIIQAVCAAITRENLNARVVFLENYDLNLAQRLVRGVDVWLNTPVRPLEASGTSGMKVALNGGLNFSILDGWWDEAFDAGHGWAIGSRDESPDDQSRDEADAEALYNVLEQEIVPLYYSSPIPTQWIQKMKASIMNLGPRFSAQRMVLDYVRQAYKPAQLAYERWNLPAESRPQKIRDQLQAEAHLRAHWKDVEILGLDLTPAHTVSVGERVTVQVKLKSPFEPGLLECLLIRTDVSVHQGAALKGPPGAPEYSDALAQTPHAHAVALAHVQSTPEGIHLYETELGTHNPEVQTYTVRVTPNPEVFPGHLDLHLVAR